MAIGAGWVTAACLMVAVGTAYLLAAWSRQPRDQYLSPWNVPRARGGSVMVSLGCVYCVLGAVTAPPWVAVAGLTVVTVLVAGLFGWVWRRNRGITDPAAGRSQAQRVSEAGALISCSALFVLVTTSFRVPDDEPHSSALTSWLLVLLAVGFGIRAAVLLVMRERCPTPTTAYTVPGWYADLCFSGDRFWTGSSWHDRAGRSRRYRLIGLYWVLYAALVGAAAFFAAALVSASAFFAAAFSVASGVLLFAAVLAGVLVGGGIMLTVHPLARSPREDVPPVLPPRRLAPAGWYPAPEGPDPLGIGQLRWWDGAAWTDWTYSADRI